MACHQLIVQQLLLLLQKQQGVLLAAVASSVHCCHMLDLHAALLVLTHSGGADIAGLGSLTTVD